MNDLRTLMYPEGNPCVSLSKDDPSFNEYEGYFSWGESILECKAYKKGYKHSGSFEVIERGHVSGVFMSPRHWKYDGVNVEHSYSTFNKGRVWKCPKFGKLSIIKVADFYVIYLCGIEVGKYSSVKNPICDFINKLGYARRCRLRGCIGKERPSPHFIELNVNRLGGCLSMFLLMHIYYVDIEIG